MFPRILRIHALHLQPSSLAASQSFILTRLPPALSCFLHAPSLSTPAKMHLHEFLWIMILSKKVTKAASVAASESNLTTTGSLAGFSYYQRHTGNSESLSLPSCHPGRSVFNLYLRKKLVSLLCSGSDWDNRSLPVLLWVTLSYPLRKSTISSPHLYLKLQSLIPKNSIWHFCCFFKLNRMKMKNKQK